jgi:hypothetical protein
LLPERAEIPLRIPNQDSLQEVYIASEVVSGLIRDIRQHLVHIKSELNIIIKIPTTRIPQKLLRKEVKEVDHQLDGRINTSNTMIGTEPKDLYLADDDSNIRMS